MKTQHVRKKKYRADAISGLAPKRLGETAEPYWFAPAELVVYGNELEKAEKHKTLTPKQSNPTADPLGSSEDDSDPFN